MLLLAPLYSTRIKSKHRQMVQLLPFHFFWRKNCTVPSGEKFSPVFPVKRKALLVPIAHSGHVFKNFRRSIINITLFLPYLRAILVDFQSF